MSAEIDPRARHFVIGMSHANTLAHAHRAAGSPPEYLVIPLTGRRAAMAPDVVDGTIVGTMPGQVRSLFLALYGNAHNSFALVEQDPPIWTKTADGRKVPPETSGRRKMSRGAIRRRLSRALMPVQSDFAAYRKAYPDAAVFVVGTPPPICDEDHIRANPSAFADRLEQGVAPASLRVAVYAIQMELIAEFAAAEGFEVIAPPPEAVTPAGELAPAYWNRDPTHGNPAYGKLVFEQIRATATALRGS